MNLFFVYDTAHCKADEDDPKDAVMYFFPSQVSDTQHYLLCCQLAGIAKFLKTTFSSPSVIGLDEGKFAFLWSGKYLLVLGASSRVKTSFLHDQLLFLCGIFCFYHGSVDNVLNESKDRQDCIAKLELAWSRYITLSQRFGNVLQISPITLPLLSYKKSSAIVTIVNRLLHMCQTSSYAVAGAVFYNSRIVSTQFMPRLTNYLSLMTNSNASAPVTDAPCYIQNLPPDVELKTIYLSSKCFQSILKHNHTRTGPLIRMKALKPQKHILNGVSSGSEGDIDSGNCSEIPREEASGMKGKPLMGLKSCKYKSSTPCCVGHSRIFARNLLHSRNHNSLKLSNDFYTSLPKVKKGDDDYGFHLMTKSTHNGQKHNTNFKVVNVICHAHKQLLASSFVLQSKLKHTNLKSSRDSEFQCSLCFNHQIFILPTSLKQWNSNMSLSDSFHDTCNVGVLLKCWENSHLSTSEASKVQLLKCRSHSFGHRRSRSQSASKRLLGDSSSEGKKSTGSASSPKKALDKAENLEINELQKHVLYVQRYGGATLLLLLNKPFDDEVVNYLWNSGFTVLKDLDFDTDKQFHESSSPGLDASFYSLLYNHVHKTLKEYPHSPSAVLSGKQTKETIQDIQQHFLNDPHFKMISLLSGNQMIFAFQKDKQSAFYLEQDINSRKLEALSSLSKKSTRRLEKLFKIVF